MARCGGRKSGGGRATGDGTGARLGRVTLVFPIPMEELLMPLLALPGPIDRLEADSPPMARGRNAQFL